MSKNRRKSVKELIKDWWDYNEDFILIPMGVGIVPAITVLLVGKVAGNPMGMKLCSIFAGAILATCALAGWVSKKASGF